jgi:hypothetical protein
LCQFRKSSRARLKAQRVVLREQKMKSCRAVLLVPLVLALQVTLAHAFSAKIIAEMLSLLIGSPHCSATPAIISFF